MPIASRRRGASWKGQLPKVRQALAHPKVQAKLSIGTPGDRFEEEAERVADQVMRMPAGQVQRLGEDDLSESERGEKILMRRTEGSAPLSPMSPVPEQDIRSLESGGEPLSDADRCFFEPRFGRDFGSVRIHSDAQAESMASALRAQAFTVGGHVAFGRGDQAAGELEHRQLLAHELVHVVQQGEAPLSGKESASGLEVGTPPTRGQVQRKIVVGGSDYTPTAKYLQWLRDKGYGEAMVEFINSMHNGGKAPDFVFRSYEEMGYEVRVRSNAIKGMNKVNVGTGCCSYPTGGGDGKLDSTYWEKKGFFQFVVKSPLPSGKGASDAIESIFKSGAGTELECNSTMVAIQYLAMLRALGKREFDKRFPGGAGVVISPHHQPPTGHDPHPIWDQNLYKEITITGAADLLPGDWVYFKNVPDYGSKHPGGLWTGEHAMYLGGGKFQGFGTRQLTETELNQELLDAYNTGLPAADQKTLADVIGLRNYARRPVIKEILR